MCNILYLKFLSDEISCVPPGALLNYFGLVLLPLFHIIAHNHPPPLITPPVALFLRHKCCSGSSRMWKCKYRRKKRRKKNTSAAILGSCWQRILKLQRGLKKMSITTDQLVKVDNPLNIEMDVSVRNLMNLGFIFFVLAQQLKLNLRTPDKMFTTGPKFFELSSHDMEKYTS